MQGSLWEDCTSKERKCVGCIPVSTSFKYTKFLSLPLNWGLKRAQYPVKVLIPLRALLTFLTHGIFKV